MSIYFIQSSDGAVKIGRAKNIKQRLGNLQTAHAFELKLLRVIPGGEVEEWECHYEFRDNRIRGEWFSYTENMLTFQPTGTPKISLLKQQRKKDAACTKDHLESVVSFVRRAVLEHPMKQKDIAKLMGLSPSSLSRKLSQSPDDSMRFTLDDLEKFIEATGDTSPVVYLAEKYLAGHDRIAELERELAELRAQGGR